MSGLSRKTQWIVWGLLAVTTACVVAAFICERLVGPRASSLPVLFPVGSFTLTNQLARPFSSRELEGRVWVANVLFTRCAGPCPRLAGLMAQLQSALGPDNPARLVSITTDPEYGTPAVLAHYGERFQTDSNRWFLLTGSREQVQQTAVKQLKFTALEKDPAKRESASDLFYHSTIFVVVDKRGNVRTAFESEEPESRKRILEAVTALNREP